MDGYHINVFWSAEDEQWIADVPDLPGCSASGETPEDAVKEVQIAQAVWLAVAHEAGDKIPDPASHGGLSP